MRHDDNATESHAKQVDDMVRSLKSTTDKNKKLSTWLVVEIKDEDSSKETSFIGVINTYPITDYV